MSVSENKLKGLHFWLSLGTVNHLVCIAVILFGCAYSGFICQGDAMKSVLSVYVFTIFTPQLALEVILLLAIFLVFHSMQQLRDTWRSMLLFLGTLLPLVMFAYWQ